MHVIKQHSHKNMKNVRNKASHVALDLTFLDFWMSDHEKLT